MTPPVRQKNGISSLPEVEFDRYAGSYEILHAQNIRLSGEDPNYFAEYKVRAVALNWRTNDSLHCRLRRRYRHQYHFLPAIFPGSAAHLRGCIIPMHEDRQGAPWRHGGLPRL